MSLIFEIICDLFVSIFCEPFLNKWKERKASLFVTVALLILVLSAIIATLVWSLRAS